MRVPNRSISRPAIEQADRIGELKGEDDVGVVDLGPAELPLQRRLEDADDLPVDVVDGRGEEQQPADDPAEAADRDVPRPAAAGARARTRRPSARSAASIVCCRASTAALRSSGFRR